MLATCTVKRTRPRRIFGGKWLSGPRSLNPLALPVSRERGQCRRCAESRW